MKRELRINKIIAFLAAFIMLLTQFVSAKGSIGSVCGDVYKTDIKTFFFGEEINSYNIGGRTVIVCEDLHDYYGFNVFWLPENRTLEIYDRMKLKGYTPDIESRSQRDLTKWLESRNADYSKREAPKHIYNTDIVTYFEGREIPSYNLGGETAIVVEDLRNFGYSVEWNEKERTLNVNEILENRIIKTNIGNGYENGTPNVYNEKSARDGQFAITAECGGVQKEINAIRLNEYYYGYAVPVNETLDFFGISHSFENSVLTVNTENVPKSGVNITVSDNPKTHNDMSMKNVAYMFNNGAIVNGKETKLGCTVIVGHFDRMSKEKYETDIYVCGETAYIPLEFVEEILGIKEDENL